MRSTNFVTGLLILLVSCGDAKQQELIEAVKRNHFTRAEEILKSGVDPNFGDSQGRSPLGYAYESQNYALTALLFRYGADDPDVVRRIEKQLLEGIYNEDTIAVGKVFRTGFSLKKNASQYVTVSINNSNDFITGKILKSCTELPNDGAEIIPKLISRSFWLSLEVALSKGADLNFHDTQKGRNALQAAILENNFSLAGRLIDYGIDVTHKDKDHKDALFYANLKGHDDLVDKIIAHHPDYSKSFEYQQRIENHKQIEKIRIDFYALQKMRLQRITLDTVDFFFDKDKIRKVVVRGLDKISEYYYNDTIENKGAYFVFEVDSEGSKNEGRFYFKDDRLIRWLDSSGSDGDDDTSFCFKERKIKARSMDLITLWHNRQAEDAKPSFPDKVKAIQRQVIELNNKKLEADTIHVQEVTEEYYYSHKIRFLDPEGILVKVESSEGGDHAGSTRTTYYNTSGMKIYEHYKHDDAFGQNGLTEQYFEDGILFRSIFHMSLSGHFGGCYDFKHVMIPRIENY